MTVRERIRLPAGLQEVAEAAGLDAAIKLAVARGGTRFFFAKDATGSELEKVVGPEAAAKIAQVLGGNRIYIPQIKPLLARRMRQEGYPVDRIALALKCSDRAVYKWTAQQLEDRQIDLFG